MDLWKIRANTCEGNCDFGNFGRGRGWGREEQASGKIDLRDHAGSSREARRSEKSRVARMWCVLLFRQHLLAKNKNNRERGK